jgi:hypothetical protein
VIRRCDHVRAAGFELADANDGRPDSQTIPSGRPK